MSNLTFKEQLAEACDLERLIHIGEDFDVSIDTIGETIGELIHAKMKANYRANKRLTEEKRKS